ncbi:hypothetical protein [Lacrimispora xylanisolvens]|uniref:hypothetical protein n=1 Tax=Lacrimispora xylanisolvens TaxID=384636 RepID=UPI002402CBE3
MEEKIISIPVTWSSDPEYDGEEAGEYIFEPTISKEYTLAYGVELPVITVTVGDTGMMLRGLNSPYKRTGILDLTQDSVTFKNAIGGLTGANPLDSDITITGEGWYWYLHGNDEEGYPEKTLLLDNVDFNVNLDPVSINLPEGSTIMLADNSSNFINNTYTDPEEKNTCINAPSLKVGGKGDLYVTAGTENSYGSVGINASSDFTLEDATLYIRFNNYKMNVNFPLLTESGNSGIIVYQRDTEGEYTIEATWDERWNTFIYSGDTAVTEVMIVEGTPSQPKASATISNKTVSGRGGKPLSGDNTVTISVLNDSFTQLEVGRDVSSWFSNLPIGLNARVESASDKTVTVTFSGTPIVLSNEAMAIVIPADCLTLGQALAVKTNSNAKFSITGLQTRSSVLDLTGEVVSYINELGEEASASPLDNDIINTGEGWTWYLNENTEAGYPKKTLVLDGVTIQAVDNSESGIIIPDNTTIVLADGSDNLISAPIAVWGKGKITIKGSGELSAIVPLGLRGIGLFCTDLIIEDGTITASALSNDMSYGIRVSTLDMTGGTLYAKSGPYGGSTAAYFSTNYPNEGLTILHKMGDEYTEAVSKYVFGHQYLYGNGIVAYDLKFAVSPPVKSASVSSQIVTGMTGTALSGNHSITITLTNEVFSNLHEDENVSDWFQNLPEGIIAKIENIYTDGQVSITFSGTPTQKSYETMSITIPADKLASAQALSVAKNSDTRFKIEQAGLRSDMLDLTSDLVWYRDLNGELVSKNPRISDINDTSEGWKWFHSQGELLLEGINLISSDETGIKLPAGTRVLLADGSDNHVSVSDTNSDSNFAGIYCTGDMEMAGNTGRLQISAGDTFGTYSTGIYALGIIYFSGGEITSTAGDAYYRSVGIATDSGIEITDGTVFAKSGSVSSLDGIATAIHARYGIIDDGMDILQKVEGEYTEPAIVRNNGNASVNYVFADDIVASDIRISRKAAIKNAGGKASVSFSGTTIDLSQISSLFTVDKNAGNRIYAIEEESTGAGTISGNMYLVFLRLTKARRQALQQSPM